jgi:hypothetical protein
MTFIFARKDAKNAKNGMYAFCMYKYSYLYSPSLWGGLPGMEVKSPEGRMPQRTK